MPEPRSDLDCLRVLWHGLVQQRSSLHVPMYFSMVRRSACCAGLPAR
jgi:hypothetical protein